MACSRGRFFKILQHQTIRFLTTVGMLDGIQIEQFLFANRCGLVGVPPKFVDSLLKQEKAIIRYCSLFTIIQFFYSSQHCEPILSVCITTNQYSLL